MNRHRTKRGCAKCAQLQELNLLKEAFFRICMVTLPPKSVTLSPELPPPEIPSAPSESASPCVEAAKHLEWGAYLSAERTSGLILEFKDAMMEPREDERIDAAALYEAFFEWCANREPGRSPSRTQFGRTLRILRRQGRFEGLDKLKSNGRVFYCGYRFRGGNGGDGLE